MVTQTLKYEEIVHIMEVVYKSKIRQLNICVPDAPNHTSVK